MSNYSRDNGFVSISLVITVSSLLLAFAFTQSIEIGHFFDQTRTKEYRLMNHYNAYSCIDQAILSISHDYFFSVDTPLNINKLNCTIDSVKMEGDIVHIKSRGNYKNIRVNREARVKLFDDRLEIISIE